MNGEILKNLLENGIENGAYPCYAAAVGGKEGVLFREFGGDRALYPDVLPITEDTLFDMASLSKLIGTTMAALKLIESGRLSLEGRVGDYFESCCGKESITVFELMTHTSGIKAHFPLWLRGINPNDAVAEILREPFGYETGSNAVYTCMGYILLGKIIEKIENEPLDRVVKRLVFEPLGMKNSFYCPPADKICAATERDADSGEIICGAVHDENARFLGGVSGNAGIFCTLDDCIIFAEMLAKKGEGFISKRIFELAITDHTPNFDEHRGLGFQLVGRRYGHTGFTGTSIFVHRDTQEYLILLTNRVHPTRERAGLYNVRKSLNLEIFGE